MRALLVLLLGLSACGATTDWSPLSRPRAAHADDPVPGLGHVEAVATPATFDGFALCDAAIAAAERQEQTPPGLLGAIGRVETGRLDPGSHAVRPWPWSINIDGQSHFYASQAQAVAATRAALLSGAASIDVGCLQVNLQYHPNAFRSLQDAFDPVANALYAARFLKTLWGETAGSAPDARWRTAAGFYHSHTPELAEPYRRQVDSFARGACTAAPAPATGLVQRRPDPLVVAADMVLTAPQRPAARFCGGMARAVS